METGADVWLRDKVGRQAWLPAIIQSKVISEPGFSVIIVKATSGEESTFKLSDDSDADHDDVKLRNAFEDADTEDLINLPYLHEPAILCCLEQRYRRSNIYTYTGPILIAVNPFKKVNLYSAQTLELYYNVGLLKSQGIEGSAKLSPHVFAVADAAFRNMMNGIQGRDPSNSSNCNQSILISGESGAGKTESTKIVLRYLTTVGNSSGGLELAAGSVMDKILQSNPILEAFGNARTIRNDNSSRFGKFIELNFNRRGHLIGGTIRTYLLEKVRLPTQQPGERNFHVFYQMAVGGTSEELEEWDIESLEDFWFANQGGIFTLQHVNDADEYQAMRSALNTLNFPAEYQKGLFHILAGLLHLGQLQFVPDSDGEGSELSADNETRHHLLAAARLLGLEPDSVAKTLTVRIITTRSEVYEKKLTNTQASDARDALAKAIYGKMFLWIVDTINVSVQIDPKNVRADIGVLDIFGFECFKQNSFEQLCINYTNETLQQQFNQFIFKMEQLEYQREKIEWSFVEFPDNQDCLDLIEHKLNGVLAMIDDECKLPKASDEKLAGRMYKAYESNKRFSATIQQKRDWLFCINHYAGPVVYSTITFVDKNKDELPKESFSLLQTSKVPLLPHLFSSISGNTAKKEKQGPTTLQSVGSQFKEQLGSLMEKIYSTSPHYIRCLKPNDQNIPDCLDRVRVTEQLRYGGVLEAVRVARSGFPVRLVHADFYGIYRPLANPFHPYLKDLPRVLKAGKGDPKALCEKLLSVFFDSSFKVPANVTAAWKTKKIEEFNDWSGALMIPRQSIQLGQTKVFLRKNAHDLLESKRSRRLVCAAQLIQCKYRGFLAVKMFTVFKQAIETLQRAIRVYLATKKLVMLRRAKASLIIQTGLRRFLCYHRYQKYRKAVIAIQSHHRRLKALKFAKHIRLVINTIRLQKIARMLVASRKFIKFRRAILALQCKLRCNKAKQTLKELRIAAKDIGRLQQSNESLKAEIEMLKAKAAEDARRLQEQMRLETEARNAQIRDQEIVKLTQIVEDLEKSLLTERRAHQESEQKLSETLSKYNALEHLLETEFKPKMELANEAATLKIKLVAADKKLQELELQLRVQSETHSKYEAKFIYSGDDLNQAVNNALDRLDASKDVRYVPSPPPAAMVRNDNVNRSRHNSLVVAHQGDPQHKDDHQHHHNIDILEYERLLNELKEEKTAKEVLEEEVGRLRMISMDLNSQVDMLRRQAASKTQRNFPTATPETSRTATESVQSQPRGSGPTPVGNRRRPSTLQQQLVSPTPAGDDDDDEKNDTIEELTRIPLPVARTSMRRRNSMTLDQAVMQSALAGTHDVGVMEKFEKNVELLQQKLKVGMQGQVWDGAKVIKVDAVIKLDDGGQTLTFFPAANRARFAFFSRIEVDPIKISTILDCSAGSNIPSETSEDYRMMTITVSSESVHQPRIVCFKVSTKEERNTLITALRALSSNMQMAPATPTRVGTLPQMPVTKDGVKTMKKRTVRDTVLEEAKQSPQPMPVTIPPAPLGSHQPLRKRNSNTGTALTAVFQEVADVNVEELKTQLQLEKTRGEKAVQQVAQLTNELIEREEQINELKKREAEFGQRIAAKDKVYEQDAVVRMQLGKRLEQVLMDKEDALEQVDNLKEQLRVLKESLEAMSQHVGPLHK